MDAKYKEMRSSFEHYKGFPKRKMVCLETDVVMAAKEHEASVSRTEQMSLENQSVPALAEQARKVREPVSAVEAAARLVVADNEESPSTQSNRKSAEAEARAERAQVELNGRNNRVVKFKAHVQELKTTLA